MMVCVCWICTATGALKAANDAVKTLGCAVDAAVERSTEHEMNLSYLLDEVEAAVNGPLSQAKARLRKALEVTK